MKVKVRLKFLLLFCFLVTLLLGCSSFKNWFAGMKRNVKESCFKVTLFSGGKVVREYYTTYVNTISNSDGWEFEDVKGRFIRLSGTIEIIEVPSQICVDGKTCK